MPDGLAQAPCEMIHGRFSHDQRKGVFNPELAITSSASTQDEQLTYTGRQPSQ